MAKQTDTMATLLAHLARTYDFGPALNRRLAAVLVTPALDPVLHPPAWLGSYKPRIRSDSLFDWVDLGTWDDYEAHLRYVRDYGRATFVWGCRRIRSEGDARVHWRSNRSRMSATDRPHATRLIDYAAAICKYRRWPW